MAYTCVMAGPAEITAQELRRLLAGLRHGTGPAADGLNPGSSACERTAEALKRILGRETCGAGGGCASTLWP
jgi:hypothetical protein